VGEAGFVPRAAALSGLFAAEELRDSPGAPLQARRGNTVAATPSRQQNSAARDAREYVTRAPPCTFRMSMDVAGNRVSL